MTKKEIIQLFIAEIEWHKEHPQNMPEDWRQGFIDGMKHAKKLIKNYLKIQS